MISFPSWLTSDQFHCSFENAGVFHASRPSVNTSLPTSKGSSAMCTFMSYGKSETIGHKIEGKDKKKFINLKGNSFTAFLVTFIQHSVAFFVPREVIWMKKKELALMF